MSAVDSVPTNRNFLSPLNFRMVLKRAPTVNFFLQEMSLPGLSFEGNIQMPSPFVKIPLPGDHLDYDPLKVSFMVDEDLVNYLEIFNWMLDIAGPNNLSPGDTSRLYGQPPQMSTDPMQSVRSDVKLIILSSAKNPNMEITFMDAFPVQLGDLNFNTTEGTVKYLESSVTFNYTKYTINRL